VHRRERGHTIVGTHSVPRARLWSAVPGRRPRAHGGRRCA
jgi:hypothetical protein